VNVPDTALTTFPADDHVFAAFVRQAYLALDDHARRDPATLEASLRRWHTRAVVRERHSLASFGEPTWYVYRDGHPGVKVEEAWWQADDAPTVEFGADGVFTFADDAVCELVGLAPGALVGCHWTDLVPASARGDDGAWIWEQLDRAGWVQSVFDLPLGTGVRIIEYRTERVGDGRFRSHWRGLATTAAQDSREAISA
jgi:PAS domain-containing protein